MAERAEIFSRLKNQGTKRSWGGVVYVTTDLSYDDNCTPIYSIHRPLATSPGETACCAGLYRSRIEEIGTAT